MEGKTILITGGSGGIGLKTADLFFEAGANVVITDKIAPEKEVPFTFFQAEAGNEKEVKAVVSKTVKQFRKIDFLFNNCGVGANLDHNENRKVVVHTVLDMPDEALEEVMRINFLSAVYFTRHTIPHMPKSDESCIVTASSIWAKGKLHHWLPYAVSKSALTTAGMNWAYQFAPIRSVVLTLGAINTPMLWTNPNAETEAREQTLLKRAGKTEEVAKAVMFAATCRYFTAAEINLDGGSLNR